MQNLRVVLVRPRIAANIGAVARVMKNFGVSDLRLVTPEAEIGDPRALLTAANAADILESASVTATLQDAVADCLLVSATSARAGGLLRRQSVGSPRQLAATIADMMRSGPVALVFGPEPSGLPDPEVALCHHLIQIPTDPRYPALNLAQAAGIILYELHNAWQCGSMATPKDKPEEPLAAFELQDRMFALLRAGMEAINFLHDEKADALAHGIRHLLGKARLTEMEVKLLMGLAMQMTWIAQRAKMDF